MVNQKRNINQNINKSAFDWLLEISLISLFIFGLAVLLITTLIDPKPSYIKLAIAGTSISGAIAGLFLCRFVIELSKDIQARRERGDPIDFEWVEKALGFLKFVPRFPFGSREKKTKRNSDFGVSNEK